MSYQVDGKFKNKKLTISYFYLNADKPFNPARFYAPIIWEGFVDGIKVRFIQTYTDILSCEHSFDWENYSKKLDYTKPIISKAIDDAMRIMD